MLHSEARINICPIGKEERNGKENQSFTDKHMAGVAGGNGEFGVMRGRGLYSVMFKSGTETVAVAETDKEGESIPGIRGMRGGSAVCRLVRKRGSRQLRLILKRNNLRQNAVRAGLRR